MSDLKLEINYVKYLIVKRQKTKELIDVISKQIKDSKELVEKLKERNEKICNEKMG